jgi:RNA-directed DNA polymerase
MPGWQVKDGSTVMFRPQDVAVTRYLYRGTQIYSPWEGILAKTA